MNNNRTELPPSSTTQDNTDDDNNTPLPTGSSPPNAASLNAGVDLEMGGGGQEVNEENTNPNVEVNSKDLPSFYQQK